MELLILVAVLATSLILLAAGVDHVVGQATFRSRMRAHQVFGPGGVRLVGAGLPLLELLVAAGSFWAVTAPSSTGLVVALLLQTALFWSFAGYLAMVVRAGNAGVACGCGPAEVPVGRSAIARAAGLGVLSAATVIALAASDTGDLAVRADARGLLAGAAALTFAVLLVILPSARRLEVPAATHRDISAGPGDTSGTLTIGSP